VTLPNANLAVFISWLELLPHPVAVMYAAITSLCFAYLTTAAHCTKMLSSGLFVCSPHLLQRMATPSPFLPLPQASSSFTFSSCERPSTC
jgi:hypothetical protein